MKQPKLKTCIETKQNKTKKHWIHLVDVAEKPVTM